MLLGFGCPRLDLVQQIPEAIFDPLSLPVRPAVLTVVPGFIQLESQSPRGHGVELRNACPRIALLLSQLRSRGFVRYSILLLANLYPVAVAIDSNSEMVARPHVPRMRRFAALYLLSRKRAGQAPLLPEAVRLRIADEHAEGKSLNAIAVALNEEGVPTAKGGRWYASTIRHVVHSVDVDGELAKVRSEVPV